MISLMIIFPRIVLISQLITYKGRLDVSCESALITHPMKLIRHIYMQKTLTVCSALALPAHTGLLPLSA